MTEAHTSGRYPYTYCADFIREHGPQDGASPILSRADAARLKCKLSEALGMSEKDLAEKLADAFIAEHAGGMTMAYTPTTIDPYAEGIEAGRAGLDETENPYDCVEEKISFWAWQDGWNSIVDAEDQIGTQHD